MGSSHDNESRRPPFAHSFPSHEGLDVLVTKFAEGDYASLRAGARRLAASDAAPEVKAAALELERRTRPPTLGILILLGTLGLMFVLANHWTGHAVGHATSTPATTPATTPAKAPEPTPNH